MRSSDDFLQTGRLNQPSVRDSDAPKTRFLSIGYDACLMNTRSMVLCRAGYEVQSCTSREALCLLSTASLDLVLVCSSAPHHRVQALAKEMR